MRSPRLTLPVLALTGAVAATLGTGVGIAATKKPPTFKACATAKLVLTLANGKGKCAHGTHAVTLGAQGPVGPKGDTGAAGSTGASGTVGATGPGSVFQLDYRQAAFDSSPTDHPTTVGPLNLKVACWAAAGYRYVRVTVGAAQAYLATGTQTLGDTSATQEISIDVAPDDGLVVQAWGTNNSNDAGDAAFTARFADGKVATVFISTLVRNSGNPRCTATGTVTMAS